MQKILGVNSRNVYIAGERLRCLAWMSYIEWEVASNVWSTAMVMRLRTGIDSGVWPDHESNGLTKK
jgi:hypothetical protein